MSKAEKDIGTVLLFASGTYLLATWLSSRPNCRRGCQTVAQHLREHAVQEFIRNLGLLL